jgi:hypothetical protein
MSENNVNIIHEEPSDIQVKNKNKIIIIGALVRMKGLECHPLKIFSVK